jgi:hypothetical protein
MKTHEIAESLKALSKLLKAGPNVDIRDLHQVGVPSFLSQPAPPPKNLKEDLPLALSMLVSLSMIDKQEWLSLINELGLNIELRPRDASRDIMGKVLRLLEKEPSARALLTNRVRSREPHASPELARALSSLLNN